MILQGPMPLCEWTIRSKEPWEGSRSKTGERGRKPVLVAKEVARNTKQSWV